LCTRHLDVYSLIRTVVTGCPRKIMSRSLAENVVNSIFGNAFKNLVIVQKVICTRIRDATKGVSIRLFHPLNF
jgi:hypothetical protein